MPQLRRAPGLARLAAAGAVELTAVGGRGSALAPLDGVERWRDHLLTAPAFWREHVGAELALHFIAGEAFACGNARRPLDHFAGRWDWIGAAWKWAAPGTPFVAYRRGG